MLRSAMTRRYKMGLNRDQAMLLPPRVDDYVGVDNPVRVIDAYVEQLDLQRLGFVHADGELTAGQPAYPPGALLKLYLYGYLMRVRSSRRLEAECQRNLEVMWLLAGLTPGNRTIAWFRKANAAALKATCRDFVLLCRELDLYGRELVAIDGSFFRGNAGAKGIYTQNRLKRGLQRLDQDIAEYLAALEAADAESDEDGSGTDLADKLEQLRARQVDYQAKLEALQGSGENQLSEVDPDARRLKKHGQNVTGYNVQMSVDSKHKLLVAGEATSDGNDSKQLARQAKQAKTLLAVEHLEVVADVGYHNPAELKECCEAGITPWVPQPPPLGPSARAGRLVPGAFDFDAEHNGYRCPQGEWLRHARTLTRNGHQVAVYKSTPARCRECPLASACLPRKKPYRELYRSEYAELVAALQQRMETDGAAYLRQRKALAEHPFGTLKRWSGWDHFLVRGREAVNGELSLMTLCYNFRRVLTILGIEGFRAYLAKRRPNPADPGSNAGKTGARTAILRWQQPVYA
jgi:transposase